MAEVSDTPPADPAPVVPAADTPAPDTPADDGAGDGFDGPFDADRARRLIDTLRGEVRDLRPLATKARELEEAGKTEVQRLTEAQAAAEKRAADAELRAMRLEVGTEKGLPAELSGRLTGQTREEMLADAEALLAAFPAPVTPATGSRPRTALRGGTTPDTSADPSADETAAAIMARRSGF